MTIWNNKRLYVFGIKKRCRSHSEGLRQNVTTSGKPRKRISYGKIYEVPNNIEYEAKMQIMHCDINSPCAIILKQKNIFVKGLIINFL